MGVTSHEVVQFRDVSSTALVDASSLLARAGVVTPVTTSTLLFAIPRR
jgi:hypothetical protein